jgi:hypothetical protein
MKKKILKIMMWVVIVIVVALTFLWFLGTYGYDIQNHFRAERQEKAQAVRPGILNWLVSIGKFL